MFYARIHAAIGGLAALAALGPAAVPAAADSLIYNGGTPNPQNGDDLSGYIEYESFTLATAATVGSVSFTEFDNGGYDGSINFTFSANNNGLPGTI